MYTRRLKDKLSKNLTSTSFSHYVFWDPNWEDNYKSEACFNVNEDNCSKFILEDFDGNLVEAKLHTREEVRVKFKGILRLIGVFLPRETIPELVIRFSKGVGRGKGSWKGGITSDIIPINKYKGTHKTTLLKYCSGKEMKVCKQIY